MFCPNCGVQGEGNFCIECGHALKQSNAPDTPTQNETESVITKRMCNALIKDAEPDFDLFFTDADLIGVGGVAKKALNVELSLFKKLMGGLWVGGTAYLTGDAVLFHPNTMNRLVHKGNYSVRIPLNEISGVEKRFGFVTQIIDIKTSKGILSIRCFWPDSFIATIKAQMNRLVAADGPEQVGRASPSALPASGANAPATPELNVTGQKGRCS